MSDSPSTGRPEPEDPLAAFGGSLPPRPPDDIDPLLAEVAGPGIPPPPPPRLPVEPTSGGEPAPAQPPLSPSPPPPAIEAGQPPLIDPSPIAPPVALPPPPPPPPPTARAREASWDDEPPRQPPAAPPPGRSAYPTTLEVEYREMNRGTTFFRGILLYPVWLVLNLVSSLLYSAVFIARLGTFFRRKHPEWLFTAQAGAIAYMTRAYAYMLLLTDEFPPFSQERHNAVQVGFDGEPQGTYSRWQGLLFRWVACTPHLFVLSFLFAIIFFVLTPIAWFAILFTKRYPQGLFNFVEGSLRWSVRVTSYLFLLNDRFPPYGISAAAAPASGGARTISFVGGAVLAGGTTALVITAAILGSRPTVEEVSYARLLEGRDQVSNSFRPPFAGEDESIDLTLMQAYDPADELLLVIEPSNRQRVVVFEWRVVNRSGGDTTVAAGDTRLVFEAEDEDGELEERTQRAILFIADNQPNGVILPDGERTTALAVFVIPAHAEPLSLYFAGGFASTDIIQYDFD